MRSAGVIRKYLITVALALTVWQLALAAHASPELFNQNQAAPLSATAKNADLLTHLPMDFIENRGQWQTPAKFIARKGALAAAIAQDGITLRYANQEALKLYFEGASKNPTLIGERKRAGHYNYISGNNPKDWQLQVPSYESVLYRSLYDGIDFRVREEAGKLEYEVLLNPAADLTHVVLRAEGALKLKIADDGALLTYTVSGVIRHTPPLTWEVLPSGEKRIVTANFRVIDSQRYGFEVPQRDHKLALVIDPGLDWSTFLGGSLDDSVKGVDIARDGSGDILVTGLTTSTDFPQAAFAVNRQEVYVARLSATGNTLQYVTFLSGNAATGTYVGRLAADESGGVAIVGYTGDTTFPVTAGAYQMSIRGGGDVFVARLNHVGALTASTFLGGTADEDAAYRSRGIAFDQSGSVIVAGATFSPDFPTTSGAYDRTFNPTNPSVTDTFIARLSPDLNQLTYSTFFSANTWVKELVVDPLGYVTITGETLGGLPTTAGALDTVWNNGVAGGGEDGFVSRFKLDGAGLADLKYSTYLGGLNRDEALGLALDPNNSELVTVVGWTWQNAFARDFPTTSGSFRPNPLPQSSTTTNDPYVQEGFVTLFRFPAAGGGSLVWSSFIGGPMWDHATDVSIDSTGAVIVLGGTRSYDFPTTRGAYDRTLGGIVGAPYDCFISRFSADGSQLLYSTLLGGNGTNPLAGSLGNECEQPTFTDESHIIYAGGNSVIVVGETKSPDFPTTPNAFDASYASGPPEFGPTRDTFVTQLTLTANNSGDLTVATPVLVSPGNGAVIPNTSSDVTLTWNAVADASGIEAYNYQVSSRPDFADAFIQYRGSVRSNSLLLASVELVTWYWRIQTADRAGNLSEWSAPFTFRLGDVATVVSLSTISLSPSSLVGGNSSIGTVTLSAAAPAGGIVVSLSDNSTVTSVPTSVTVAAGSTSANFTVTTSAVSTSAAATISAVLSGVTRTATLTVNPAALSTPAAPVLVFPAATATVAQPVTFDWSDVPSAVSYEIQIDNTSTIAAPFITSQTVNVSQVTIGGLPSQRLWWRVRAQNAAGVFGPFSATRRFTPQAAPATASLSAVAVNPTSVLGGTTAQGTVTLTSAAPTGGAVVSLSDNSTAVTVPTSVTIPAGATSATFSVNTTTVSASTAAIITGSFGAVSRTSTLTVTPVSPVAASLNTLALNPTSVLGGTTAQGTVTLTSAAPTGGVVVSLSDNSTSATVPTSVTVPAGASSAGFTVTTSAVTTSTAATISAVLAGVTKTAGLTINPVAAGVNLTVTASGRSGVQVLSSPAGINVAVGSTQSASFTSNSVVTLSVSNSRDAIWSGACSSGGSKARSCTFTITGNASVTANVQ